MTRPNSTGQKQRRLLAAGTRIRGQWRYHVRTTRDPFDDVPLGAARSDRGVARRSTPVSDRLATG